MKREKHHKVFIIGFGTLFILGVSWLVINLISDPDAMVTGTKIPEITFIDKDRNKITLDSDNKHYTLIILFDYFCEHCRNQLNELDKNISRLNNVKIFLLTSDLDLFKNKHTIRWRKLTGTEFIKWGIVDNKMLEKYFGWFLTPSEYLYGTGGKLVWKNSGTIKVSKIAESIKKNSSVDSLVIK